MKMRALFNLVFLFSAIGLILTSHAYAARPAAGDDYEDVEYFRCGPETPGAASVYRIYFERWPEAHTNNFIMDYSLTVSNPATGTAQREEHGCPVFDVNLVGEDLFVTSDSDLCKAKVSPVTQDGVVRKGEFEVTMGSLPKLKGCHFKIPRETLLKKFFKK